MTNDIATVAGRGWQPIETAPKDGTHFLCLRADGKMTVAFRRNPSSRTDEILSMPGLYAQFANHWMPLPEPPAHLESGS